MNVHTRARTQSLLNLTLTVTLAVGVAACTSQDSASNPIMAGASGSHAGSHAGTASGAGGDSGGDGGGAGKSGASNAGASGTSGQAGSAGDASTAGNSGASGQSGSSGNSGTAGASATGGNAGSTSVGGNAGASATGGNSGAQNAGGVGGASGTQGSASCAEPCAEGTVCVGGACQNQVSGDPTLDNLLLGATDTFNEQIFLSQQPDQSWKPSTIYHWQDFLQALATMHMYGVGDLKYWLGEPTDSSDIRYKYALANVAAFLAQSMKETIMYDACDENNWDGTNGYKISNSCGQLGQNYESYDCDMACPKDPTMAITAVTNAKWYGAPGPMFCAPNSAIIAAGLSTDGSTGAWNYSSDCWPYPAIEEGFEPSDEQAYLRPACQVYAGQKGGGYVFDGSGGSVEGCGWWGRGVIQTTGRCNFGKLNHYLGQTHLTNVPQPATVLYPDINFCKDSEVICASADHPELKWIAGFFYWMSSVQSYNQDGWSYLTQLRAFVDGGMTDTAFIDSVSGIVNRGCHNPPCATGPVDGGPERRENFSKVLEAFGLP